MQSKDQALEMVIHVRVTTMNGWEPELSDVRRWLDDGDAPELVAINSVREEGSKLMKAYLFHTPVADQ